MVVAFEQRRLPFLRSSAELSVPKHETSSPPLGSSPLVLPYRLTSTSNDMATSLVRVLRLVTGGRRLRMRRLHLVDQPAHPPVRLRCQGHARRLAPAAELVVQAAPVPVVTGQAVGRLDQDALEDRVAGADQARVGLALAAGGVARREAAEARQLLAAL